MIVAFASSMAMLARSFPRWKRSLARAGALWICWRKRASGNATDVGEKEVRDLALELGLVDVKICAIDCTWSGLKCVYRLRDRA
jgi:hypothetical protein